MSTELVCPFKNEIIYSDSLSTEQELWLNQNVYGVIYKITNTINNKSYIGRRKCIKNKLGLLHRYWGSGSYIKNAIKKYGKENFIKEYLDFAMSDEELDKLEILYIEKFGTYKNGYNQTVGGEHFRGEISNIKSIREKQSAWSKRFWSVQENHDSLIQKRTGRKNSDATKMLMSESAKKSWTDERRKKASESGNYIHLLPPESRKSQIQKITGSKWVTNDVEQFYIKPYEIEYYLSKGFHLGKLKVSDEAKKRMSEAAKNRKPTTKGKKMIHKDNIRKYVLPCDLQKFLDDGWLLGPVK